MLKLAIKTQEILLKTHIKKKKNDRENFEIHHQL